MRIMSYSIVNFRGISGHISKNRIVFNDSNTLFLFGNNNVGKSTLLKSYEFFYKDDSFQKSDFFQQANGTEITFELELLLDNFDFEKVEKTAPKKIKSLKEKWLKDNKLKIRRKVSLSADDGTISKPINLTLSNKCKNWGEPEESDWEAISYGGIGFASVFRPLLPKPIFIKAMPTEKEVEDIVNTILADKAKRALKDKEMKKLEEAKTIINELQEKMYNPVSVAKYKNEVNKHYAKLFPKLKIEISDSDKVKWTEDKFGKKFAVSFKQESHREDASIPSDFLSVGHGAVRTAIFTLMLMMDVAEEFKRVENRKDYIVLFEEPELFLHPKLLKNLRELIYKVSESDFPYQVLCASHSPQMIDLAKPKSSIIRMAKMKEETILFQVDDYFLSEAKDVSKKKLKHEMYEVLRFNPYICESFYADEVLLVEGPTEEIIVRGYLSEVEHTKHLFVVNCGTVTNIPFYQKVFSRFNIKYHVVCDTDNKEILGYDDRQNPLFAAGIQKSISDKIQEDKEQDGYEVGLLRTHDDTFEPAHKAADIPVAFRYKDEDEYKESDGKPFNANRYWRDVLSPNLENETIKKVPIIKYLDEILNH